jgi:hypothetical protein
MEDKFAKIISAVLFPIFFPSYIILILFYYNNFNTFQIPLNAKFMVFAIVFITTCVFPLLFFYIMKRRGMIKSIRMETREERVFPLIITTIFFFMAFYMLKDIEVLGLFLYFLIGSTVLLITALLINFLTKISIHMIGVGGLTGALIGLSLRMNVDILALIFISIFLSGLTGYARLKLQAHNQAQTYGGFVCGLVVMLLIFLI